MKQRACQNCAGTGLVPEFTTCVECGSGRYEVDWGCYDCGEGNPYKGIACLTLAVAPDPEREE